MHLRINSSGNVEKETTQTFQDLEESLKSLLLNGRVGVAESLVAELSVESLSLTRTQALCGYPFDFTQPGTEDQDEIQVTQAARNATPGRASLRLSEIPSANQHTQWVLTLRQLSSVYYELQQFVRLIALFREWREEEDSLIQLRTQESGKISTKRIKEVFDNIQATIGPLLESYIEPTDDAKLWKIRKAYVPELIIAYISCTQAASLFIHRDSIVKAMEVATLVADQDKEWLQRLFMETGRMKELVDTLALVSRTMLKLGDLGDAKKLPVKKRGSRGETLRIWDLSHRN